MVADWPYGGGPSPDPRSLIDDAVADVIAILRLLELPEPHASLLSLVFHTLFYVSICVFASFVFCIIRQSVFITLFRSLTGTETRRNPEPWSVTLCRLVDPHHYDNIVTLSCYLTTFAVSLFLLAASVAASSSWIAAFAWVMIWFSWLYAGWRYCQPMKPRYTREDIKLWSGKGVWVHTILLVAALAYFPSLRQQLDDGIVRLHESCGNASPAFLRNIAHEIIYKLNPPEYKVVRPVERQEYTSWN
ncbi:hypothetical protein F4813DRAFT_368917 [Daldinia decipiens]|uniref:uncharacterized protein n=1 Tax=Daldinia decipiens TaxID=326647 RepID=UPI0020C27601|nr:uncharacterized protein F4813DRAFT_368917 [Daldinia decipiens]KAI1654935.1 hypothetical protein F4813DRAFT_368917 [Daldinia decipiens]